ncbi:MAG: HD domain-containing protein [Candidatus Woesearchaeota archaeon]
MEDIIDLKIINQLKSVYRASSVKNRKESSAEHTWSCLILADFFLEKTKKDIDKVKVYELLMYHDLVEIISGDYPLNENREGKKEKEKAASYKLKKLLPEPINNKFFKLFNEFEELQTIESKFAKAIDSIDAMIHELDYKKDWKGWTEDFLRSKKEKYFKEFPEIDKYFKYLLKHLKKEGYII